MQFLITYPSGKGASSDDVWEAVCAVLIGWALAGAGTDNRLDSSLAKDEEEG